MYVCGIFHLYGAVWYEHSAAFVIWLPHEASEPGDEVERTPVATPARGRPADKETPQPNSVEPTVPSAEDSVPAPGGKPTKPKKVLTRQVGRFQRAC